MRAVWLCGRATLRRRWRAVLTLALLVGLAGGAVVASVAGARRTASAFPRLLDELAVSDVGISAPFTQSLDDQAEETIRRSPLVADAAVGWGVGMMGRTPDGGPDFERGWAAVASADGRFGYRSDRPLVVEGRMPRPDRADEAAVTQLAADNGDLAVGDVIAGLAFDVQEVTELPEPEDDAEAAALLERYFAPVDLRVTGIVEQAEEVAGHLETGGGDVILLTPAFAAAHRERVSYRLLGVDLAEGVTLAELQRHLRSELAGAELVFSVRDELEENVRRSVAPPVGALGAFAVLLAVASFVIVGQALSRMIRAALAEQDVLATLGLGRAARAATAVVPAATVALTGALVAVGVAVALSPLFPVEPVRDAEISPGVSLDAPVLVAGAAGVIALVLVRAAVAAALVVRRRGVEEAPPHARPGIADRVAGAGLPVPAVVGVRLAGRAGSRTATPLVLTLVGSAAALAALVGTVLFATSLDLLLRTPDRYGWRWDGFVYDPPEAGADTAGRLTDDPEVVSLTAAGSATIGVEGDAVFAVGFEVIRGDALPPTTEGRFPQRADEVALGPSMFRRLDVELGDRIEVRTAAGETRQLTVVGRTLLPAVFPDVASSDLSDAIGLTFEGLTALTVDPYLSSYLVDLAPGAGGVPALQREFGDLAFGPQQPPDIRNYERVRSVPIALGVVLGVVGAGTLAHALVAAVRSRRRDLALFKALGFTRPQVWSAVAWQAGTIATLTVLIGAPLGVAIGRQTWFALADYLAVPSAPASVVPVLVIAVPATFALALLLAAGPGWRASRVPPARVLRAE